MRIFKPFLIVAVVALFVAASSPVVAAPGTVNRLDENDAVAQSIAVSKLRFPDPSVRAPARVVLSRDDNFADSLSASALLGDAPLLFTGSDSLDPRVLTEIQRLLPVRSEVILMGGEAALSDVVERQIVEDEYEPFRLHGATRVETSVATEKWLADNDGDTSHVLLARASGPGSAAWADSVSAGAFAAANRTPILLTQTDALHPAVAAELAVLNPDDITVLGGPVALSETVAAQANATARWSGPSRAATAAVINDHRVLDADAVPIAFNGYFYEGWINGLLAAGVAADTNSPTLLMDARTMLPETAALWHQCDGTVYVYGSELSVPDSLAVQLLSC